MGAQSCPRREKSVPLSGITQEVRMCPMEDRQAEAQDGEKCGICRMRHLCSQSREKNPWWGEREGERRLAGIVKMLKGPWTLSRRHWGAMGGL